MLRFVSASSWPPPVHCPGCVASGGSLRNTAVPCCSNTEEVAGHPWGPKKRKGEVPLFPSKTKSTRELLPVNNMETREDERTKIATKTALAMVYEFLSRHRFDGPRAGCKEKSKVTRSVPICMFVLTNSRVLGFHGRAPCQREESIHRGPPVDFLCGSLFECSGNARECPGGCLFFHSVC